MKGDLKVNVIMSPGTISRSQGFPSYGELPLINTLESKIFLFQNTRSELVLRNKFGGYMCPRTLYKHDQRTCVQ